MDPERAADAEGELIKSRYVFSCHYFPPHEIHLTLKEIMAKFLERVPLLAPLKGIRAMNSRL